MNKNTLNEMKYNAAWDMFYILNEGNLDLSPMSNKLNRCFNGQPSVSVNELVHRLEAAGYTFDKTSNDWDFYNFI